MNSVPHDAPGLLLLDKPQGWTSHDLVSRTRRAAGTRRVGHAGTLDPMATGLMVLGVNRATKFLTHLVGADKTYTATIRLGEDTLTDDAEGETLRVRPVEGLDREMIERAAAPLTGPILQVPSTVSAIKVDGKRSYARVRDGDTVELKSRPVTIHRFELGEPRAVTVEDGTRRLDVDATVECSSGTYIRALARDLGQSLGTGGHLTALRRLKVGGFDVSQAMDMDDLTRAADIPRGEPRPALPLLPVEEVARSLFPVRDLTDEEVRNLGFGRTIDASPTEGVVAGFDAHGLVALLRNRGQRAKTELLMRIDP